MSKLLDDPTYARKLRLRLIHGELPSGVEQMLWHYVRGKPKETITLDGVVKFTWAPREPDAAEVTQLKARVYELEQLLAAATRKLLGDGVVEGEVVR